MIRDDLTSVAVRDRAPHKVSTWLRELLEEARLGRSSGLEILGVSASDEL